jgi:hypothetical protein
VLRALLLCNVDGSLAVRLAVLLEGCQNTFNTVLQELFRASVETGVGSSDLVVYRSGGRAIGRGVLVLCTLIDDSADD